MRDTPADSLKDTRAGNIWSHCLLNLAWFLADTVWLPEGSGLPRLKLWLSSLHSECMRKKKNQFSRKFTSSKLVVWLLNAKLYEDIFCMGSGSKHQWMCLVFEFSRS